MKNLIVALSIFAAVPVLAAEAAAPAASGPRTKEVCKDSLGKDGKPVKNKDGTTKQQCKTIKVHKKYEGTPVPPKK